MDSPIIQHLEITELNDHPKNEELYGPIVADQDTIESIRERGVLQPLIISLRNSAYFIVAGHRRRVNAFSADLKTVPCIVRVYNSTEEEELDLIHSNKHRKKNEFQINNEIKALNKIYKALNKKRQLASLQNVGNSTGYDENLSLGGNPPNGKTVDLISEETGLSVDEVKKRTAIHSEEYREKFFKKLIKNNVSDQAQNLLMEKWDHVRTLQETGEISVNAAYVQILEIQEAVLPTEEKPAKPKPVKAATPLHKIEVCAQVGGLKCGFMWNDGIRKLAVEDENGKVDVFEWDNVLKHVVMPILS